MNNVINIQFDIIVYVIDILNFIIPMWCIYTSLLIIFYYRIKKEFKFQLTNIIISIFYLYLLYRFSILEKVNWSLDFILWSLFEFFVFLILTIRNYLIINEE